MSNIDRYKLITQYPKDEFFDVKQVFKFDSYETIRILNKLDKKCKVLEKALELACTKIGYIKHTDAGYAYYNFIEQAEKELEGLVGRTKIETQDRTGARNIVKIKYRDFN